MTKRLLRFAARGYTIVELSIVLVVAGLLLSGAIASFDRWARYEQAQTTRDSIDLVKKAIVQYAARNRTAPREITVRSEFSRVTVIAGVRETVQVTVQTSWNMPPSRPYLPCPDIDGDGIEDRVENADLLDLTVHIRGDGNRRDPPDYERQRQPVLRPRPVQQPARVFALAHFARAGGGRLGRAFFVLCRFGFFAFARRLQSRRPRRPTRYAPPARCFRRQPSRDHESESGLLFGRRRSGRCRSGRYRWPTSMGRRRERFINARNTASAWKPSTPAARRGSVAGARLRFRPVLHRPQKKRRGRCLRPAARARWRRKMEYRFSEGERGIRILRLLEEDAIYECARFRRYFARPQRLRSGSRAKRKLASISGPIQ